MDLARKAVYHLRYILHQIEHDAKEEMTEEVHDIGFALTLLESDLSVKDHVQKTLEKRLCESYFQFSISIFYCSGLFVSEIRWGKI